MKKLENAQIKEYSFAVLRALKAVCEKHGLSYSLTGGTLIGAVRHQGFIPWDDDIDVMMSRTDYNKLIQIAKIEDLGFDLFCAEIYGEDYWYPFAKACHRDTFVKERNQKEMAHAVGVFVDIFPVDGIANHYWTAKLRCMCFQFLHGLKITSNWTHYHRSKLRKWYYEPFRYVCYLLSKMVSRRLIDKMLDLFVNKKDYIKSRYAGRLVGDYGSREIMEKSLFESKIKVTFEGEEFDAIADYDIFLTRLYGDYMQLPPVEKQVTHHEFDAFSLK